MIEELIVLIIVILAIAMVIRRAVNVLRRKTVSCGCEGGCGCTGSSGTVMGNSGDHDSAPNQEVAM
jgi:hypothetical protein